MSDILDSFEIPEHELFMRNSLIYLTLVGPV